ncbi:MAG TPA: ElyC/SanA/YdcF family protein, partial [Anaerolineaceae bacterium]|nr:ElyC/SanA/YdcF family protein [Anaerolineaceae bacterium]
MFIKITLYLLIISVIGLGLPRLITLIHAKSRLFTPGTVPFQRAAIVFGAGLQRDGTPSPVLRDRVATAAELYFNGRVEKLLMSGDNRFVNYNEPGAMHDYAISLGVPEEDIVLDYAGRRTYDTCYRAHAIFGLDAAILVTQGYHLPRALITCNNLGIEAVGVAADRRSYHGRSYAIWQIRELPATFVALWQVWVTHPLPVLGQFEPIFPPTDDQTSDSQTT